MDNMNIENTVAEEAAVSRLAGFFSSSMFD